MTKKRCVEEGSASRGGIVFRFALCPECQTKYAALRFDPAAVYSLNIMPLNSLIWADEHPDANFVIWCDDSHEHCRTFIIRLVWARTQLWRTGSVPEESHELWEDARRLLPDWPGFRRLSLDRKQMASLDSCVDEMDDFMDAVRARFPNVTTTSEGGGLTTFTATRHPSPAPRKWWQFWK